MCTPYSVLRSVINTMHGVTFLKATRGYPKRADIPSTYQDSKEAPSAYPCIFVMLLSIPPCSIDLIIYPKRLSLSTITRQLGGWPAEQLLKQPWLYE